ncbi:MAG: lysine--tRNA ligase, partial [Candidatus Omnitrophota bacterium]
MLDELRENRLRKIGELRKENINPYPHRYLPVDKIVTIVNNWEEDKRVKIAGRIMAKREHGKSAFIDIKDHSGKIQVYFKKDIIGENQFQMFADYIDIG